MVNKATGNFRHYLYLCVASLIAASLLLISSLFYPWSSTYPILGQDSITDIGVVEDHKLALSRWLEKEIEGSVLINIDAHDDFKNIADQKITKFQAEINRLSPSKNAPLPNSLLSSISEGNFIYAAAKLGIVSEIFWVVPTSFLKGQDRYKEFQDLMTYHRFQPDEIQAFSFKNNMYSGLLNDIPIHICEISSLPKIKDPVLLSIDSDYAPVLAANFNESLLESNIRVFKALSDKRYKIRDAVVAYSVNGGHLKSYHRWVGDMIVNYLKQPDLIKSSTLPDKYLTLQQAERLRKMNRHNELMQFLFPVLEKDIYDPSILTYMAYALDGMGMKSQSVNCAEKACFNDQNYCYGLCELGCKIIDQKGLASAEVYFLKAYKGNPTMAHSQFIFARALQKAGRYDEALTYFNSFKSYYGPLPADFYIGKTYTLKGDINNALRYYNSARQELAEDPNIWVSFGDRSLVKDVIRFYEKNGHDNHAEELRVALKTGEKYYPNRWALQ